MANDAILKGLTAFIKAKSSAEQAQNKFATALQLDKMKNDRNFMQKIAEKEQMNPYQRIMMEQYEREQQGGMQPDMGGQGMATDGQAGADDQAPDMYALPTEKERYDTTWRLTNSGPKQIKTKVSNRQVIYRRIKKTPEEEWSARDREFVDNFEGIKGEKPPNRATLNRLKNLSEEISAGDIKTIADVQGSIERNREVYEMEGADVDYILNKAKEILPESFDPATMWEKLSRSQMFNKRVKGGVVEEQRGDKWVPVQVSLPEQIKTTSEAVRYLQGEHNLTGEDAIEWLRNKK